MRRIYDPSEYAWLADLQPWNEFVTYSVFALVAFQAVFFLNFFISMWKGRKAEANPWQANSLEWTIPSPPPHGNFREMPTVYRGPYEYSVPGREQDYFVQSEPPPDREGESERPAPQPTAGEEGPR